jgi:radical SAM superfamily enzyme YgiQ (UPF0313 family)
MGYHGTVEPERMLERTGVKAVIKGEPEYAVLDICRGDNGSKIISRDFDLGELPVPAFHLLDFKRYFYEILGGNFALFETSRGCRFGCAFCNKIMYGKSLRTKSREQVFEEVSLAVEKYKVKNGYFIDLDFLSNKQMAEELCEYLIRKNYDFKWTCQSRPDLLEARILEKMKKAGCRIIHMGAEAPEQGALDRLNKNIDIRHIEKAVKLCRENGIRSFTFFLFGLPGETAEDREQALKFIIKLDPDFVSFHKLFPYKGTDLCLVGQGQDKDIDKFISRAFLKYYLRPSYLRRLNPNSILGGLRLMRGRLRTLR